MQIARIARIPLYPLALLVDWCLWNFLLRALRDDFTLRNFGACRFYGDKKFTDAASEAMIKIEALDPVLYREILNSKITLASQWKPKNKNWKNISIRSGIRNHYSIFDWMVKDGTDSFAFWTVFTYYKYSYKSELSAIEKLILDPEVWYLKCLEASSDWLRAHEYTQESIDYLGELWYRYKFGKNEN